MKQKHFMTKFFFYHMCMMIPFLMVSIVMTYVVLGRMEKMKETEMLKQLDYAETEFLDTYMNYFNEAALLSNRLELADYKMLSDSMESWDGTELLRMKSYFDNRIIGVFIEYGTKNAYTSSGIYRKQVYFKELGCGEEDMERAMVLLESTENGVSFLHRSDTAGNMMLSYPFIKSNGRLSVNFIMPFDTVIQMFRFSYEGQWYLLRVADGSCLGIGMDEAGNVAVMASEECEGRMTDKNYKVFSRQVQGSELEILLYYRKSSFNLQDSFCQAQVINLILITTESIAAAVISYVISRKRIREVRQLENLSKGNPSCYFPEKSVYHQVQHILLNGLERTKKLEEHTREYAENMRKKNAYMIFSGLTHYEKDGKQVFEELGFTQCPERFCVGAVYTASPIPDKEIEKIWKDRLACQMMWGEMEVIVFLQELDGEGESYKQRRKAGENIRKCLHQCGIRKVYVGISRLYQDPLMISGACREAVSVLQYMISDRPEDVLGCFEDVVKENTFWIPDGESLKEFTGRLLDRDYEGAKNCILKIMQKVSLMQCSAENQKFVRYALLQRLVQYLAENETVDNAGYLKKCLDIDVSQEEEFRHTILSVLKHCLQKEDKDNLTRMLEYIENNYQRSDLTYEEVAAVGKVVKTYLSRMFKNRLGVSYIEYLMSVRMEHAGVLLRTTDSSISDIAQAVGYVGMSGFRKSFKKVYGISASEYRSKKE